MISGTQQSSEDARLRGARGRIGGRWQQIGYVSNCASCSVMVRLRVIDRAKLTTATFVSVKTFLAPGRSFEKVPRARLAEILQLLWLARLDRSS